MNFDHSEQAPAHPQAVVARTLAVVGVLTPGAVALGSTSMGFVGLVLCGIAYAMTYAAVSSIELSRGRFGGLRMVEYTRPMAGFGVVVNAAILILLYVLER